MNKKLIKLGFFHALGQAAYIGFVALLMSGAERFLSNTPDNILMPITFLLLFVFSAAISGALILGRPILFYLDGKKKEAVELFGFTLLWLFVFFILMLIALITFR